MSFGKWLATKRNGAVHVVPCSPDGIISPPHIFAERCSCGVKIDQQAGKLPIVIHTMSRCVKREHNLEELDAEVA